MNTALLAALGIYLVIIMAILAFVLIVSLVSYILHAVALMRISNKNGRKYGWLAWIPVATNLIQVFVMSDTAADKPFKLFGGKIKFDKRTTSFIIYAIISVVFGGVSSAGNFSLNVGTDVTSEFLSPDIAIVLLVFILILSLLGVVISLIVTYILSSFEYVYLRDILEIYYPGRKSNVKTAVLVTIGSMFTTYLVRAIYLFSLSKKEPAISNHAPGTEAHIVEEPAVEEHVVEEHVVEEHVVEEPAVEEPVVEEPVVEESTVEEPSAE